jgi:hypothetical protein
VVAIGGPVNILLAQLLQATTSYEYIPLASALARFDRPALTATGPTTKRARRLTL